MVRLSLETPVARAAVRAYSALSRALLGLSLTLAVVAALWLASATFYNPRYVANVAALLATALGLIYTYVSAVSRILHAAEARAAKLGPLPDAGKGSGKGGGKGGGRGLGADGGRIRSRVVLSSVPGPAPK